MNNCKNCEVEIEENKKFCSCRCSVTHNNRKRIVTAEQKAKTSKTLKNLYSSGTLVASDSRVKKVCNTCKNEFFVFPSEMKRKFCSRECSDKMDRTGMSGGLRQNSGRGKQGWFKGYYCQSSWELAWVIYSLDHKIKFERNTKGFQYEFESEIHKYYPDFKLEDGSYMEIKGYDSAQWTSKQSQFKGILHVLGKNEIKPYIEYAKSIYGDDYVKMYESN